MSAEPRHGRPFMPAEYGNRGATDDPGSWAAAERRLVEERGYWVATVRRDGRPHVMPVWGVWIEGAFVFGTSRESRKGRNLAADPLVAVHLADPDEVVVIEGVAEELAAGADFDRFEDAYAAKYGLRPGPPAGSMVFCRVRPRTAFTWREADFADRATRWRFE